MFYRKRQDIDFNDNRYLVYYFDIYCRECFEKSRFDLMEECHTAIPERAWKLFSFEPEKGDSVKIIGWKNIFGWIRAYKIIQTNFAEEVGEKQLQQQKEEWEAYREASDKRRATKRNLTVEEYRRIKAEEDIAFAVKQIGLAPEEVVAGKYHELPKTYLYTAKDLRQKYNKAPTLDEIFEEEKRFRDRSMKSITSKSDSLTLPCIDLSLDYFLEYAETETISEEVALWHLEHCEQCTNRAKHMRENYLKQSESDCLTEDNLIDIRTTGHLPKTKLEHIRLCDRCRVHSSLDQNKHHKDSPGPKCFTKEDLHEIHDTGKIPVNRQGHMENCDRCKLAFEHHREIYLDKVAPQPRPPRARLVSLKEKMKA